MGTSISFVPLEVHRDSRGWVSEIFSGQDEFTPRNMHLGTMRPGVIRGNHYHRETHERIAFPDSPVTVRWGSPEDFEEKTLTEPFLIHLPPGVPHGFKNESDGTIAFGAYTDTKYDTENPDVEPVELFSGDD